MSLRTFRRWLRRYATRRVVIAQKLEHMKARHKIEALSRRVGAWLAFRDVMPHHLEPYEPRVLLSGSLGGISGGVYADQNLDGLRDTNEVGLSDWVVYLDANRSGTHDRGEMSVRSGADGSYAFTGLTAGAYDVGVVFPSGWQSRGEIGPMQTVVVLADTPMSGVDFSANPALSSSDVVDADDALRRVKESPGREANAVDGVGDVGGRGRIKLGMVGSIVRQPVRVCRWVN